MNPSGISFCFPSRPPWKDVFIVAPGFCNRRDPFTLFDTQSAWQATFSYCARGRPVPLPPFFPVPDYVQSRGSPSSLFDQPRFFVPDPFSHSHLCLRRNLERLELSPSPPHPSSSVIPRTKPPPGSTRDPGVPSWEEFSVRRFRRGQRCPFPFLFTRSVRPPTPSGRPRYTAELISLPL